MNAPNQPKCPPSSESDPDFQSVWGAMHDICQLTQQDLLEYQKVTIDDCLKQSSDFLLSIVIPVFNEKHTVATVISKLSAIPLKKELIVVDDCSTDGTDQVLQRLSNIPWIKVVRKQQNEGKGAALRTAFSHVSGDFIVVQDADLEYDPKDIPKLLVPLVKDEADVVYGSRFLPEHFDTVNQRQPRDKSWVHRMGNGVLTWTFNVINGTELTDMETCYKAFRRDVLNDLSIQQDRFGIEPELTAKLARRGFRFQEVPISYNARGWDEGKKIGIKDLFQAFYCIGRYGFCD